LTVILSTILLSLALPVAAQDSFSIDEDDLFGTDEDVVVSVDETAQGSALKSLLTTESVTVGGRFSGSASANFTWNEPWEGSFDLTNPDDYGLKPALSALLYFDGRPSETTRFYGSVKSSWPFMTSTKVLTSAEYIADTNPPPSDDPSVKTESTTLSIPKIEVFELFSDFSWNDSLYFRFGKQTINWGVGYFFSPANILNLQSIDPSDPTAQLEGPVALRAHYPIPGSQHNLWAYTVFDSATMKPEETAAALKAEFVLGRWELGIGGYFKKDDPLRGMLTATGSIRDVSLFGEATLSRGSSREWVSKIEWIGGGPPPYTIATHTDDSSPFFKGTVGFMYSNSEANISVLGQYLYDGEGYSNTDRKARIDEALIVQEALGPTASAFTPIYKIFVLNSGRHYAAASFTKSKLLTDDLSFSLFAMGNLSDFSAYIKPSLSYSFFKGMSTSLSAFFALGFDDGEYVVLNDGRAMGLTVAMTLGSGSF
jgi:hypothetical protein